MRVSLGLVAMLAMQALSAPSARAEGATLRLRISPCSAVNAEEVRRILVIELGAAVTAEAFAEAPKESSRTMPASGGRDPVATMTCDGAVAVLTLSDSSGRQLARQLDLATGAGRERLVALAIAELVAAARIELGPADANETQPSLSPPAAACAPASDAGEAATLTGAVPVTAAPTSAPLVVPPPVVPPPDALVPARPTAPLGWLRVHGVARALARPLRPSLGVAIAVDRRLGPMDASLDLVTEGSRASVSLGSVQTLVAWLGGALFVEQELSFGWLGVGAGARGGVAWMQGDASGHQGAAGRTLVAAVGGPMLSLRCDLQAAPGVFISLAAEAGYVTMPLRGLVGSQEEVAVAGPWGSLSVGAAWPRGPE